VHLPLRTLVAVGHVLPYDHAGLVAVVVPAGGLDLHVLADHVVAQLLGLDDVECERLVGRGRVEAVGPPALVERTELEQRLVVEGQANDAVLVAQLGGQRVTRKLATALAGKILGSKLESDDVQSTMIDQMIAELDSDKK